MRARAASQTFWLLATAVLAACSAGAVNAPIPTTKANDAHNQGSARGIIVVRVPKEHTLGRHAEFISPATQSISFDFIRVKTNTKQFKKVVDLTPSSPGCSTSASGTTCAITVDLGAGDYLADIATYTGLGGTGAILSQGQKEPFTIVQGKLNRIPLTLYGVPRSFLITALSPGISGSSSKGFAISGIWSASRTFSFMALDADGNAIVGVGAPALSVVSTNPNFAISEPTQTEPNMFGLTPSGVHLTSTTLTASASFADSTTCKRPGASCVVRFSTSYNPYATDDWVTFAHDFARTGLETENTEITPATVRSLEQRWKTPIGSTVYGTPVAYNGNVIVVTKVNPVVYDLSAVNGSTIWKRTLNGVFTKAEITIDTADGLVLVGVSNTTGVSTVLPGTLYALRLSSGSIAWSASLNGLVRAAPVYADGVVYEGWAGGDPPGCTNGGVSAFNAATGTQLWTWLTNPLTNPGGGGGVWGALAWDGTRVIFGTGNVCANTTTVAQGAVALNTDGTTAWSFQADLTFGDDSDTGGGTMIHDGQAIFINKNGSLYQLDSATGNRTRATWLGASAGQGGFAAPTTDGGNIIEGAGYFSSAQSRIPSEVCLFASTKRRPDDASMTSKLVAVDPAGYILWSVPMSNAINTYVAINNGIAFAGMDNKLDAIGTSSGNVLWQFQAADVVVGDAVVPSGVYAVDASGTVYALSLPPASGPNAKSKSRS